MLHHAGSYRNGIRWVKCRHHPTASSAGISHVPKHQKISARPATRLRVTSTVGASAMATMREPASTVMAVAPIATQYGGLMSSGVNG